MTFATLEEARRYVEMKRAGLATSFDEALAHDLVESVIDAAAGAEPTYTESEVDDIRTEHEAELAELRKSPGQWDLDEMSHEDLLDVLDHVSRALSSANRREVTAAVIAEQKRAQSTPLEVASKPRPRRTRRASTVKNAGGGAS